MGGSLSEVMTVFFWARNPYRNEILGPLVTNHPQDRERHAEKASRSLEEKNSRTYCWTFWLLFSSLFVSFLNYNDFGWLSIPAACFLLLFSLLSVATFFVARVFAWLDAALLAFALTLLFEKTLDSKSLAEFLGIKPYLPLVVCFFSLTWLLSRYKSRKKLDVLAVLGTAFLLVTFMTGTPRTELFLLQEGSASMPDENLPPVLYFIFDEQSGVRHLPGESPVEREAKEKLEDVLETSGFFYARSSYSRYRWTKNALPSLLSLEAIRPDGGNLFQELFPGYAVEAIIPRKGEYFYANGKGLENIRILSYGNFYGLDSLEVSVAEKCLILLDNFMVSYETLGYVRALSRFVGSRFLNIHEEQFPMFGRKAIYATGLASKKVLTELKGTISQTGLQKGRVYFIHLLIPHFPYTFDSEFRYKEWFQNWKPSSMEMRRQAYYEQMIGLYKWLETMFRDLEQNNLLESTIIIMHGDHGQRLLSQPTMQNQEDSDWNAQVLDNYFTLFAVRAKGIQAGGTEDLLPIDEALCLAMADAEALSALSDKGCASEQYLMIEREQKSEQWEKFPLDASWLQTAIDPAN